MLKNHNIKTTSSELSIDKSPINCNSINLEDSQGIAWENVPAPVTPESIAADEAHKKKHRDRKSGKKSSPVHADGYDDTSDYFESEFIADNHLEDWRSSGVDEGIIKRSVETFPESSQKIFRLIQSPHFDQNRLNSGRLASPHLKYFNSLAYGGWWCSGLDPLNKWNLMAWGCFKPNKPRIAFEKEKNKSKIIKYEHPAKVDPRAFFLRIPQHIADKIAEKLGVEPPKADEFWQWVATNNFPVTLVEGAKKAGALLTAGYIAIGLPSHNLGYRVTLNEKGEKTNKRHLIPELEFLKDRPINLALDQDEKQSTRDLIKSSNAIYSYLFRNAGCSVKILSWEHSIGKGIDDVFVTHGQQKIDEIFGVAKTSEQWKTATLFELTFDAQIDITSRYLLKAFGIDKIPLTERLIGIKSVKGTGKTVLIAELVKEGLRDGEWVLVITHRVQLGKALGQVIGVNHISEVRDSESGTLFGFAVCFESLHPKSQAQFNADSWKGKGTVILDECEQSIWSLLSSSTCENNRLPILKQFSKLIKNTLAEDGEGRVILADADLSNLSVNLIREVSGRDIKPFIIRNNWKPGKDEQWNIYRYKGSNAGQLVATLESAIALGKKVFITVTGQKSSSKYSTKNLEQRYKKLFPDLPILRIDAETVRDPSHPAFGCMANLNEVLPKYRIVIASPTIETGVSIELTKHFPDEINCHFDSVWCIAAGLQSVNSVLQSIARIRENVDRHIWAKTTALNSAYVGNGSSNPKQLYAVENAKFLKLTSILRNAGATWDEVEDEEIPNNLFYNCYLKMAARHNAGCWRYADSIFEYLTDEGHNIIDVQEDKEIAKSQSEVMGCERDENYLKERVATSEVAPFDNASEYEKAKDAREKTEEISFKEHKWSIEQRYGQECTPELIKKDDDGWHPQLRLHYYLGMGRDYLPARDKQKIDQMLEAGGGQLWKPSVINKSLSLQVAALEFFKINELIKMMGEEFTNLSPLLKEFDELIEKTPRLAGDIKTVLGVSISLKIKMKDGQRKSTPVEKINPILTKLGLTLRWTKKYIGGREDVQKIYQLIPIPDAPIPSGEPLPLSDGREKILDYWLEQDVSKAQIVSSSEHSVSGQVYKDLIYNSCPLTETCPLTEKQTTPNSFPILDGGKPQAEVEETPMAERLPLAAECVRLGLEVLSTWEAIKEQIYTRLRINSYHALNGLLTIDEFKRLEQLIMNECDADFEIAWF